MGKKILVVIDMQNDFLTGTLGNKECAATVDKVVDIIKEGDYSNVIFTRDTHKDNYLTTQEGRKLPVVHCIEGSEGWQVDKRIISAVEEKFDKEAFTYLDKKTFGGLGIIELLEKYDAKNAEEIHFVGVCTGICVISNVLITKAAFPEVKVCVIEKACACVTPTTHETAINAMKTCQVDII